MNRRDTAVLAMIAHLDAIEARLTNRFDRIDGSIDQLRAEVADLKLQMATHDHPDAAG